MVKDFQDQKSNHSYPEMAKLTGEIVSDFENNMNNDLAMKAAFDKLYETISQLHKNRELLTVKNVKDTLDGLHRVDSVLQCIF
jgi:hypothetical protein